MDKIMQSWLLVQSKRKQETMATKTPMKAILRKATEVYEVQIFWSPETETFLIRPLDDNIDEDVLTERIIYGIIEDEEALKININRRNHVVSLEFTFGAKETFDKVLGLFRKLISDESSDSGRSES